MGACPCLSVVFLFEREPRLLTASGCLLELGQELLWLTAGHVIQKLVKVQATCSVQTSRFHDGGAAPVPVVLDGVDFHEVFDDVADYGFMRVRNVFADVLRAAPTFKPLTQESILYFEDIGNIAQSELSQSTGLYVVGYPEEWNSLQPSREGHRLAVRISAQPAYAPFDLPMTWKEGLELGLESVSNEFWRPTYLYSRLPDADQVHGDTRQLSDISGISGAPVILDVAGVPRLVGVQSSWHKSERIAKWVPMTTIRQHGAWAASLEKSR